MAIFAHRLSVYNYRSFSAFELEPSEHVTVLAGRNAAGKTNLVEAMQLLTAGQSFRHPSPAELVHEGASGGKISLELAGEGRRVDMTCEFKPGKRLFRRNGKRTVAAELCGVLPSVLFCPDHLGMVKGSASVRRSALDDFGMQLNARYAQLVTTYAKVVEQRNNLLRDGAPDAALLSAWDESLVSTGSALVVHRLALLARIRDHMAAVYASVAPHERLGVGYRSTLGDIPDDLSGQDLQDRLRGLFLEALQASRDEELRRGITVVGPHRDDVLFSLDGRSARSLASQGQQRSIVLAWKIAEVRVARDILGRYPLLLLDDVMSELDAARREAVVRFIEDEVQTVITTTNLGYFSPDLLEGAKVVRIDGGR